jgi:hypothetical protein
MIPWFFKDLGPEVEAAARQTPDCIRGYDVRHAYGIQLDSISIIQLITNELRTSVAPQYPYLCR